MFGKIIDTIYFGSNEIKNLGTVWEGKDSKGNTAYYSVFDNEMVGIEDNKGEYFFAVKREVKTDYKPIKSCRSLNLVQDYTFMIVSNCSLALWLMNEFNNMAFADTDNIDNVRLTINSAREVHKKDKLIVNEFDITFEGHLNKCEVIKPCCC